MKFPIYLDYHSTTPVDPRVLEQMLPFFTQKFGNSESKSHPFGWEAEEAVSKARLQVAQILGATPSEIIFTAGTTESINLAFTGIVEKNHEKKNHIITAVTEHKATLETCKALEKKGVKITYLPVDAEGLVSPDDVKKAITPQTLLISLLVAHNEVGTIYPVAEIGKLAREAEIFFHVDAAQAVGKIPVDVEAMYIDLLSFSAHKMYGPKGVGALYCRKKNPTVRLEPLLRGGAHEQGLRPGTLNVPGIVGLGKACEIASADMTEESLRLKNLRDRLYQKIIKELKDVYLNGHPTKRLSHNLNLSFKGVRADAMMMDMKEVALSSGSACSSANPEPSYVLRAMGRDKELAQCSIRFGLGRFNTEEEIDYVAEKVIKVIQKRREQS